MGGIKDQGPLRGCKESWGVFGGRVEGRHAGCFPFDTTKLCSCYSGFSDLPTHVEVIPKLAADFGDLWKAPPFRKVEFLEKSDAGLVWFEENREQALYAEALSVCDGVTHELGCNTLALVISGHVVADFSGAPNRRSTTSIGAETQPSRNRFVFLAEDVNRVGIRVMFGEPAAPRFDGDMFGVGSGYAGIDCLVVDLD